MLLAYVDESYSAGKYWIAALICPEGVAAPLTAALDNVVHQAALTYKDVPNTAELHGHALFHGKEDWEPVATMPRARIGVYNAAFDAIASTRAAILIRGVDLKRLENRYVYPDHPHAVVLSHLLERIDDHARIVEQDVLVIADQVDLADEYRKNLWRFQRFSTGGRRVRRRVRSWRSWP